MKLCKKQKFLASGLQRPVATRNDVIAKKFLADCFKTSSGQPEDWTVSGPCHLYYTPYLQYVDLLQSQLAPATTKFYP